MLVRVKSKFFLTFISYCANDVCLKIYKLVSVEQLKVGQKRNETRKMTFIQLM